MSDLFNEHKTDTTAIDDEPRDERGSDKVWSYPGEFNLDPKEAYLDGPVSDGLDHISKSRIKTALKCLREFGYKYLGEVREGDNYYFSRGTAVHDSYEHFHRNLKGYIRATGEPPERFTELMNNPSGWFQWAEFIVSFFEWELDRWEAAVNATETEAEALEVWQPHSMEKELHVDNPPVGDLPWMGPYDVLHHAASVPEVEETEGYVVVDYKTGSVPDEQYRDKGIHIDLEFYGWMLEELDYDVVAGIGMFPAEGETIVRKFPNVDSRKKIIEMVQYLHDAEATPGDFPITPQPLCDWCHYQDQCPSSW